MEGQHPIPQNVTGFQFKLIGDMTIRQFAYLAGNAVMAYLFYLLPIPFFVKWPFIFSFALLGILLAFVPHQGRPLDRWILNFFKAVFSANQYVYETPKAPSTEQPIQTELITSATPQQPISQPQLEREPLEIPETPLLKVRAEHPQAIPETKVELTAQDQQRMEGELQKLLIQKAQLERDLLRLKKPTLPPTGPSANVRRLTENIAPSVGIPNIPQAPNLISGIVKDTKGTVLPNIIIEVKNSQGNMVRAFKTNKLGQFTAATTLENGSYAMELEDPHNQYKFDRIDLSLDGNIVLPLEIQNVDIREELRRKLFHS